MGFRQIISEIFLEPWFESLRSPEKAQREVLSALLQGYERTEYGRSHGAEDISNMNEFRDSFPRLTYEGLRPILQRVKQGDYSAILPEPPEEWVMTRGTTGSSKVIPVTRTHIDQIRNCGARGILNFDNRYPEAGVLAGRILNLNFPSSVHHMKYEGENISYGYSSGTYARLIPSLNETALVPRQEAMDKLGPGISKDDWHGRFDLAFKEARKEKVTAAMGVAPVISSFARYLSSEHDVKPKEVWKMVALFCTSVPKIHTKYAPRLRNYYGNIPIVELYTATEGAFGQQLDDLPYFSPNYDTYLFEVDMGGKIRPLWEMERGDWGRLIISSCLFPRYDIGDMVECLGKHYFRIFGRNSFRTVLEHRIYRLVTRWFI